jgi:hypothetical protein
MKTNITPGEWVALEAGVNLPGTECGHEVHAYVGEQLVLIAECCEGHFSTYYPDSWEGKREPDYRLTIDEALANAKAISAVPDLIAALADMLAQSFGNGKSKLCGHGFDCYCPTAKAYAALEKAGVTL